MKTIIDAKILNPIIQHLRANRDEIDGMIESLLKSPAVNEEQYLKMVQAIAAKQSDVINDTVEDQTEPEPSGP